MVNTFSTFGYEGSVVQVEVDLRRGIPAVDIVGVSDGCVKEIRERVIAAIRNSNLEFPMERVLISLCPADLKKEGSSFDLPIALAILQAQFKLEFEENVMALGELTLSGEVRPVRAIRAALGTLVGSDGYAIIPNGCEAEVPEGVPYKTVSNLNEAFNALMDLAQKKYDTFSIKEVVKMTDEVQFADINPKGSLDNIKGHNNLKFAMAVAVAGRHSMITWGSVGNGKTMTVQHFPELQTLLRPNEANSVHRIQSIAGLVSPRNDKMSMVRPFRMPHQTASIEGICGGGASCRPGEITLAHNGILFLDEAAEFRSSVLQMLRVPLETNQITLSRAGRTTVYPAHFQLVMTTENCPCGNYGVKDKICLCSAKSIELYWKKFSAPLLDRIAIRINSDDEDEGGKEWTVKELRELIKRATERQYARQGKLNQDLDPKEVVDYIEDLLTDEAIDFLRIQGEKYDWTNRKRANILKVARTLVDMDSNERKEITHYDIQDAMALCNNSVGGSGIF